MGWDGWEVLGVDGSESAGLLQQGGKVNEVLWPEVKLIWKPREGPPRGVVRKVFL